MFRVAHHLAQTKAAACDVVVGDECTFTDSVTKFFKEPQWGIAASPSAPTLLDQRPQGTDLDLFVLQPRLTV